MLRYWSFLGETQNRHQAISRYSMNSKSILATFLLGSVVVPTATGLQGTITPTRVRTLTAEQEEILSHMSIVYLDDGQGGTVKTVDISGVNVRIHNGLGATNGYPTDPDSIDPGLTVTNGLGNLIVGYSVSGGRGSTASGNLASVAGGSYNMASGAYACISGGRDNLASGICTGIRGGRDNVASGCESSVAGGDANEANAVRATVSGGCNNEASGEGSTVSGGVSRAAAGTGSWSGGSYSSGN